MVLIRYLALFVNLHQKISCFNPLLNDKILDWPKLKQIAENILKWKKIAMGAENILRKGKIACYKQFLLFSQCFPQLYIFNASNCDIVW